MNGKGLKISEWKYEVVTLPKIWMKIFGKFCPKYQGRFFQIFSFIFWAMWLLHIFILKFPDLYVMPKSIFAFKVQSQLTDHCTSQLLKSIDKTQGSLVLFFFWKDLWGAIAQFLWRIDELQLKSIPNKGQ